MTITDIINKTYFLTNTNVTSYPAADMLININNAYERVVSLIMTCDGRWEWDDTNQTDFPIATTTITTDQQDYALAVTHLNIIRVEIKDSNGNWSQLTPISQSDLKGTSLTDFLKTSGMPVYYDKINSSVLLYPKPNYTQTASLKIYFQRPPALYTSGEVTTGTKVPGFNSLYHNLLSLWAAHDYGVAKGIPNVNQIALDIQRQEEALVSDYELRDRDQPLKLRVVYRNPR